MKNAKRLTVRKEMCGVKLQLHLTPKNYIQGRTFPGLAHRYMFIKFDVPVFSHTAAESRTC